MHYLSSFTKPKFCKVLFTSLCLFVSYPFSTPVTNQSQTIASEIKQLAGIKLSPLYQKVNRYTTAIAPDGDVADVYFPVVSVTKNKYKFPIALLLQGALVDKSHYSNFASQVASYGFIVVVPNRQRTLTAPTRQSVKGLFSEQKQVNDVLKQMVVENTNSASPIARIVDTNKLGLLGHSFGGYVGLGAIQNICFPGVCSGKFTRPRQLMAGIFYGTNFKVPPMTGTFPQIDNQNIPTGLIWGSLDGVSDKNETQQTYNQIQDSPKALIVVEGANHYGITNQDNSRDPSRPKLEPAIATKTIARWSALFLRAHLLEDKGAFDYVYNTGDARDRNVSVTSQRVTRRKF